MHVLKKKEEKNCWRSCELQKLFFDNLGQLTALHIGTRYFQGPVTVTLQTISLHTAKYDPDNANETLKVNYVEKAKCLEGFKGFSCEECADGNIIQFINFSKSYIIVKLYLRYNILFLYSTRFFCCRFYFRCFQKTNRLHSCYSWRRTLGKLCSMFVQQSIKGM